MASRLKIFIVLTILAVLVPRIIRIYQFLKIGQTVHFNEPGPCRLIKNIDNGSEDIQMLGDGLTIVSSGLKVLKDVTQAPWKDIKGQLFLFDMKSEKLTPIDIQGDIDLTTFNPHGISIWKEKDSINIFVINHTPTLESIERFKYDAKQPTVLKHHETFTSDLFLYPNDLVAVGPRQFYFTNYYALSRYGQFVAFMETVTTLHLGSVVFFDGQNSRIADSGLLMPNGINRSPDGRFIYVSHIGEEEIRVYQRQGDNNLVIKQVYHVPGAADNINVDPDTGDLWLGVHPVPYLTLTKMESGSGSFPSQVLHLPVNNGLITHTIEVYSEDGSRYISGSSAAAKYKDKLMIGTVNDKALICDIKHHQT